MILIDWPINNLSCKNTALLAGRCHSGTGYSTYKIKTKYI
jgi:hypothetical protein